jgi:hypothetical protein
MKHLFNLEPLLAMRLFGANIASWFGTFLSMQLAKDLLQIIALFGSIAVSIASCWWILKQAKNAERKNLD